MPHDPANPPEMDLSSLAWAMWTFYEYTGATNLSEAQVTARLAMHSRVVDGVTYHRPLATAAEFITRPDQLTERERNDLRERYVDPLKVAEQWRETQASSLDTRIPVPADGTPAEGTLDLDIRWGGW